MPFLTEEIWQHIDRREPDQALIVSQWPKPMEADESLLAHFDFAKEVIAGLRTIRKERNIPLKETLELHLIDAEGQGPGMDAVVAKLANVSKLEVVDRALEGSLSFRVGSNEYFVPMGEAIDVEAEIEKIGTELKYTRGFLESVQKKLNNERFVGNAPESVVALERKKAEDARAKIDTLERSLANLKCAIA